MELVGYCISGRGFWLGRALEEPMARIALQCMAIDGDFILDVLFRGRAKLPFLYDLLKRAQDLFVSLENNDTSSIQVVFGVSR